MTLPRVVAITGATGVIYGVELLRVLESLGQRARQTLGKALDPVGIEHGLLEHWTGRGRDDQGRDALRAL